MSFLLLRFPLLSVLCKVVSEIQCTRRFRKDCKIFKTRELRFVQKFVSSFCWGVLFSGSLFFVGSFLYSGHSVPSGSEPFGVKICGSPLNMVCCVGCRTEQLSREVRNETKRSLCMQNLKEKFEYRICMSATWVIKDVKTSYKTTSSFLKYIAKKSCFPRMHRIQNRWFAIYVDCELFSFTSQL